jgi:hypothetical protein
MPHRWWEAQEQELTSVERRSAAGGAVETGALSEWSRNLGQKECEGTRIRPAKGIGKWLSQSSANRRRVGSGAHLGVEEEMVKGGRYFRPLPPLIGGGEREGRGGGGPLGSVTDAGVEPDRRTGSAR